MNARHHWPRGLTDQQLAAQDTRRAQLRRDLDEINRIEEAERARVRHSLMHPEAYRSKSNRFPPIAPQEQINAAALRADLRRFVGGVALRIAVGVVTVLIFLALVAILDKATANAAATVLQASEGRGAW